MSKYLRILNDDDNLPIFYKLTEQAFSGVEKDTILCVQQFSQTNKYKSGQIVLHNSKFYQASADVELGEFNASSWTELPIGGGGGSGGLDENAVLDLIDNHNNNLYGQAHQDLANRIDSLEQAGPSTPAPTTFVSLTDTPAAIATGKMLVGNAAGNALEFIDVPQSGGGSGSSSESPFFTIGLGGDIELAAGEDAGYALYQAATANTKNKPIMFTDPGTVYIFSTRMVTFTKPTTIDFNYVNFTNHARATLTIRGNNTKVYIHLKNLMLGRHAIVKLDAGGTFENIVDKGYSESGFFSGTEIQGGKQNTIVQNCKIEYINLTRASFVSNNVCVFLKITSPGSSTVCNNVMNAELCSSYIVGKPIFESYGGDYFVFSNNTINVTDTMASITNIIDAGGNTNSIVSFNNVIKLSAVNWISSGTNGLQEFNNAVVTI